jgi:hypothetical protein
VTLCSFPESFPARVGGLEESGQGMEFQVG